MKTKQLTTAEPQATSAHEGFGSRKGSSISAQTAALLNGMQDDDYSQDYTLQDIWDRLGPSIEAQRPGIIQSIQRNEGGYLTGANEESAQMLASIVAGKINSTVTDEKVKNGGRDLGGARVQSVSVTLDNVVSGDAFSESYEYERTWRTETQEGYPFYHLATAPFPITVSQAVPGGGGTFPMNSETIPVTINGETINISLVVIMQIQPFV